MKIWLHLFIYAVVGLAVAAGGWQGASAAAPQAGTIQTMIDNAADGAILDIPAGTYTENLTVENKNITLRGADRATTIIQAASSSQTVITATSNKGLHLENLTIKGGHPTNATGGGVYAVGGTLQIVNCVITDNSADYGGGVFLDHSLSSLVVSYSQIDLNSAALIGGGLYAAGSAILLNTSFSLNEAAWHGGGMHVQDGSTEITGGVFTGNNATNGNGGAVNVNNALTITGAQFNSNTSGDTGGAVTQWNTAFAVSISNSEFNDNSAKFKGGGAYIAGSLTLTDTAFTTNKVDSGGAGSVYGGGIYAGGPLQVNKATFSGNQAKCTGCSFNCGGGLYSDITGATVTVTNSVFDANQGWFGGGLSGRATLSVTHSSFTHNQGGYGAGIQATTLSGDWLLFQNNSVVNFGGAVDSSNLTLTHSRFINNSAQRGGAIEVHNILNPSSNLLFTENSASTSAGAVIHADSGVVATLYNVTIARAVQTTGPAIYFENNTTLNLYNSIINNYTNAITFSGAGSLTEDYNLFYNNIIDVMGGTLHSGGHSTGNLPPGFVDPAAGNYHLKSNSAAIAAGHNYGLADDLDGRPRSFGRNDAGAYQYWAFVFVPVIIK